MIAAKDVEKMCGKLLLDLQNLFCIDTVHRLGEANIGCVIRWKNSPRPASSATAASTAPGTYAGIV